MMTCAGLLAVAAAIFLVGTLLILALIPLTLALLLLSVLAILLVLVFLWRNIFPSLSRLANWAAQFRNIVFLFVVVVAVELFLRWALPQAGISVPTFTLFGVAITIVGLLLGLLFLFLLILAIAVWLARLFRYSWPQLRNVFWDLLFRFVALFWKILLGIPLGVVWFLYRPPLRWLVAAALFYFRGIAAAIAWLLYNPPLRELIRAGLFFERLGARFVAWIVYNPPVRWIVQMAIFWMRLVARFVSGLIYAVWSWWTLSGVRDAFNRGLTVESKSYQDYKQAQDNRSPAA
ncbi:MAG: hypothetical protein ACNA7X_04735 [Dehalococcoidia bacterium]